MAERAIWMHFFLFIANLAATALPARPQKIALTRCGSPRAFAARFAGQAVI
jgi:hypothetical protein